MCTHPTFATQSVVIIIHQPEKSMRKCNKLPTLISSVFIVMSVSAYGDDPLSPQELEEYITDNAQAIVNAGEDRTALQRQFDKKLKQLREEKEQLKATVDQLVTRLDQLTQALEESTASTKDYADTKASEAEQAAKTHADTKVKAAKEHADTKANAAEQAAKSYADTKASQAEQAANKAQSTAANDARNRAINAQNTANTAVSKANSAQTTADKALPDFGAGLGGGGAIVFTASNGYIIHWTRDGWFCMYVPDQRCYAVGRKRN